MVARGLFPRRLGLPFAPGRSDSGATPGVARSPRLPLPLLLAAVGAICVGLGGAAAAAPPAKPAPPAEAEPAIRGGADAVRDADAEGVAARIARGDDVRVSVSLPGAAGRYTAAQAEAVLSDWFRAHAVLALAEVSGSTSGSDAAWARSYRL